MALIMPRILGDLLVDLDSLDCGAQHTVVVGRNSSCSNFPCLMVMRELSEFLGQQVTALRHLLNKLPVSADTWLLDDKYTEAVEISLKALLGYFREQLLCEAVWRIDQADSHSAGRRLSGSCGMRSEPVIKLARNFKIEEQDVFWDFGQYIMKKSG